MKEVTKITKTKPPVEEKNFETEKHLRLFCDATSQQLNNTLGTIVGELDYALSSNDPKIRDRAMHVALGAAEKALSHARNLRYFAVHTSLRMETADLSQIMIDTVDLVEREFETKNIKINVLAEASTYCLVDKGALQQILLNLLYNSATAIEGGGKITLTLRQLSKKIEIRCTDTGKGISSEELERIFQPYYSKQKLKESEGLGLPVVKALVESHGGEIFVESTQNKGTTFNVFLPFDKTLPKPSPFETQRAHRRVQSQMPATLVLGKNTVIETEIEVLSVDGCFIRIRDTHSVRLPDVNDLVRLKIHYFKEECIEVAQCRVASVNWIGPGRGIGVQFMQTDEKAKRLLTALVLSHAT